VNAMRFFYADPGLLNNQGHHANSCRSICRELRQLDVKVVVLGCLEINPDLKTELGATPFFHGYTYSTLSDGDPVCGPLSAFDLWPRIVAEDLQRLVSISAEDVVYLNSAQPAQFMGLIRWWKSLPDGYRPHVVMEFGTDPGADVEEVDEHGKATFHLRDYRIDPRPMFYRFAARHLSATDLRRFHMATFDETTSGVFSAVLGHPVGVLPLPQDSHLPLSSRVGHRPITVAVLGHQRPDKGYQLIPAIARALLDQEPGIRFLIQNSVPADMPKAHEEVRALANASDRVLVDERAVGGEPWADLLRRSDLMLCPYDPPRYVASYSAVATDAVANAIPLVVPAKTSMARLLAVYGEPGVTYNHQNPTDIVATTRRAISGFDALATLADAAAARWTASMGAANTAKQILALCNTA